MCRTLQRSGRQPSRGLHSSSEPRKITSPQLVTMLTASARRDRSSHGGTVAPLVCAGKHLPPARTHSERYWLDQKDREEQMSRNAAEEGRIWRAPRITRGDGFRQREGADGWNDDQRKHWEMRRRRSRRQALRDGAAGVGLGLCHRG